LTQIESTRPSWHFSKSVVFTEEGLREAERLFHSLFGKGDP
jgi:hypothetical protein